MDGKRSYAALTDPISQDRLNAIRSAIQSKIVKHGWIGLLSVLGVGILVGLIVTASLDLHGVERFIVFGNIMGGVLFVGAAWLLYQMYATKRKALRQIRFQDFAKSNGMVYTERIDSPAYLGVIFDIGNERRLEDVLIFIGDGEFEVGNYTYVIPRSKSNSIYRYGVIRIKLPRHVAHMLLDGKSNNTNIFGASLSNLPVAMKSDQTLRLEGDFNDHFTLYAPKEYERDALYVFTPDLMALLIDTVAQYDAEVIDDQLFIYGKKFDLLDAATWEKIFAIISTVGNKAVSQTDYYADDRVGNRSLDVVAEPGRRLRRGITWQAILVLIAYAVYVLAQIIADR